MVRASDLIGGGGAVQTKALVVREYTEAGTYSFTVPHSGLIGCAVIGGGGSGAATAEDGHTATATGGGGGGFAYGEYDVVAGTVLTIVVGSGGVEAYADNRNTVLGNDGGATSISGLPNSATLTGTGGQGGRASALSADPYANGGSGIGGFIQTVGGRSGSCVSGYRQGAGGGAAATIFGAGGNGGDLLTAADLLASAGGAALVDCPAGQLASVQSLSAALTGLMLPGALFAPYGASGRGMTDQTSTIETAGDFCGGGGVTFNNRTHTQSHGGRFGGGGGGAAGSFAQRAGVGGVGYAAIYFRNHSNVVGL